MKVNELRELIKNADGELEIFIRNTINSCGNIEELAQIESDTYQFFGKKIPCLILNTNSYKNIKLNDNDEVIKWV